MTSHPHVASGVRNLSVELPSWAFGNSGTRFKVFAQKGVPRTPFEKIADAAQVHAFTGVAPSVALHIPWDRVDDYGTLAKHAADLGMRIGAINSNVFQDDDYMLGSVTNPDARVRRKATDHLLDCVDIMDATGSRDLKLWFSDGTNYPGQDDIAARQDRLAAALAEVYDRLGDDQRFLLEYKLFEPSFYTMDVPDWGTAYAHCIGRTEGAGRHPDRAPRARHEHRVHRGDPPAGREARRVRLQLALLRRRRPHGRLGRSVPALPHHVGGTARGRAGSEHRRGVHARPVPQHRGEDRRADLFGHERAGGDGQGAARRCRRVGGGAGGRRCAGRARAC